MFCKVLNNRFVHCLDKEGALHEWQAGFRVNRSSEVWEDNKCQTNALESVILGRAKKIHGCSSKACNEAVRGDMGLETLKSGRYKVKMVVQVSNNASG